MTVRSEKECLDLLAKEMASLPDREIPPTDAAESAEGSQVSALSSRYFRLRFT